MKKRTNIPYEICLLLLHGVIIVILLFCNNESVFKAILNVGSFSASPGSCFNTAVTNEKVEMAESDEPYVQSSVSSVLNTYIPDDIYKIMKAAEEKVSTLPKDGKIVEKDYSRHNATSEYDGIYLRNTTLTKSVDIKEYLQKPVYANINTEEPSVLIYHTHATETYELCDRDFYSESISARSEKTSQNMIRVGEEICRTLNEYGFLTIHDKTIYDTKYSGAYERSCEAVSQILKDNPSIQIVLDVHRGTIYQKDGTRIKTVTEINGQKAAQVMLISGCEEGNVTDFPNWKKNLSFAVSLQKKLADDNPTLVRPLMLCTRKYNMHLLSCALQLEIGTDANTLSEAVYSARLFAQSLSDFLKEYV